MALDAYSNDNKFDNCFTYFEILHGHSIGAL